MTCHDWRVRGAIRTFAAASLLIAAICASGSAAAQEAAAASTPPPRTLLAEPPRKVPEFKLTDQRGHPFGSAQLRGQPALIFFGFTNCPSICPTTMQRLAMLVRNEPELDHVRVVLISVDGDRDTPEVLAKYLARFSASFIGLTGPPRNVSEIARSFTASFFKGSVRKDGGYDVDHSGQVFLLDPHGDLRATFFDASQQTMAEVIRSVGARDPATSGTTDVAQRGGKSAKHSF
jgi:protein SCO1/2